MAKIKILARFVYIESGNFGDYKQLAKNLFELQLFSSPRYQIYWTIRNNVIVLLLTGGDKPSQQKDIAKAKQLLGE